MRKLISKTLTLILLALVLVQSIALFYLHAKYEKESKEETGVFDNNKEKIDYLEKIISDPSLSERENIDNVKKKPIAVDDLKIMGWIPDWDIPNGLQSIQSHGNFDTISPVWFWPNSDGTLKITTYANDISTINYAKNNGIELIPTITLFDENILSSILNNDDYFQTHVNAIVNQVVVNDYDGIDLDYESILLTDKEKFYDFLEKISLELAERDKKFVFTVMPKWGEDVAYMSLPQTRLVQDYKRIADLVDEFRIMTYEFSARNSTEIGPIAPLEWMEDTLKYAIYSGIPREKIILGVHTYAYDFRDRPIMQELEYKTFYQPRGAGEDAIANFYETIQQLDLDITFNEEWGEALGTYDDNGQKRIIVFPNQESIDLRKQLAADYGIKGVVYWRVGDEGSLIF